MDQPIVFISHWTVKPGKLDDLKRSPGTSCRGWRRRSPGRSSILAFFDDEGTLATFVHAFADPDSLDLHFEGADRAVEIGPRVHGARWLGDLWAAQRCRPGVDAADGDIG